MATTHSKSGTSLDQTNSKKNITKQEGFNSEARWQQQTMIIYVMHELTDAMEQERAANNGTPMNQGWQQFLFHLQKRKPQLITVINSMLLNVPSANEEMSNV